jgi:hypothetical protein
LPICCVITTPLHKSKFFHINKKLIKPFEILKNHGYEPQNNLWEKFPQQAAVYYTLRFAGESDLPQMTAHSSPDWRWEIPSRGIDGF